MKKYALTPAASDGTKLLVETGIKSRLYYEAHVTIPPVPEERLPEVDELCSQLGWQRSTFVMHKNRVPNAFVSARHADRDEMILMVHDMIRALTGLGYEILRWKIEDTLLDSNRGDLLLVKTSETAEA